MLEKYVEDNYNARFDTHSCHHFREIQFNGRLDGNNARLDVKPRQSYSSTQTMSRVLGHSAYLKSMLSTITMQGLTLTSYHRFREMHYNARLDVNNARLDVKS